MERRTLAGKPYAKISHGHGGVFLKSGRSLLFYGVAVLALVGSLPSSAATYYGRAKGSNAAVQSFVNWYDAQTGGNQVSVTPAADDGNIYVFVGESSSKVAGGNFPGKAYFGADGSTVGTEAATFSSYSTKTKLTMADCTLIKGYFNINDGPEAMAFGGHYHIPANCSFSARAFKPAPSGTVAARNFTIASDAVFTGDLTGVFHFVVDRSNNCVPLFTVSGDMSGFKGTLQAMRPVDSTGLRVSCRAACFSPPPRRSAMRPLSTMPRSRFRTTATSR